MCAVVEVFLEGTLDNVKIRGARSNHDGKRD